MPLPTPRYLTYTHQKFRGKFDACDAIAPSKPHCNERQRVAVCLSGSPRTFVRQHVHRSIANHLIRGLKAQVDVFAVMQLGDIEPKNDSAVGGHANRIDSSRRLVASALARLAPRAVVLEEGNGSNEMAYGLSVNSACHPRGYMGETTNQLLRSVAQPAAWRTCFELMERAERTDGSLYDWVVRTRPDIFWFYPHPPVCVLDPQTIYAHFWVDFHFVLPRRVAEPIMHGMAEEYQRCKGPFPHNMLEGWLRSTLNAVAHGGPSGRLACLPSNRSRNGVGLNTLLLPMALVRNDTASLESRWAVRDYCLPYALVGNLDGRGAVRDGTIDLPPCHMRGLGSRAAGAMEAAYAHCLRRAYPAEAGEMGLLARHSRSSLSTWWETTVMCKNVTLVPGVQ